MRFTNDTLPKESDRITLLEEREHYIIQKSQ